MKILQKSLQNIPVTILTLAIIAFVVCQLVINSILAPLGSELQSLNSEKNYLVEENRQMEEKMAKTDSITAIQKLSEKSLSISPSKHKTVVYLEEASIVANK